MLVLVGVGRYLINVVVMIKAICVVLLQRMGESDKEKTEKIGEVFLYHIFFYFFLINMSYTIDEHALSNY